MSDDQIHAGLLALQIVRALSATRAAMDAPAGRVPFKPNGAAAKNPGVLVPFAGPSGTSGKGPLKPSKAPPRAIEAAAPAAPPVKPPLPPPVHEIRARIQRGKNVPHPNHVVAAAAEEALANTIHALPDEVVLYWGEVIGTHGSDVVSYNLKTKTVTLWDAKYRGKAVGLAGSQTFAPDSSSLTNALIKARDAVVQSGLSDSDKLLAIKSLNDGNYRTRTVGAGNAQNSVFENKDVRSK